MRLELDAADATGSAAYARLIRRMHAHTSCIHRIPHACLAYLTSCANAWMNSAYNFARMPHTPHTHATYAACIPHARACGRLTPKTVHACLIRGRRVPQQLARMPYTRTSHTSHTSYLAYLIRRIRVPQRDIHICICICICICTCICICICIASSKRPPREIPEEMYALFTMNGSAKVIFFFSDCRLLLLPCPAPLRP
jgi:hypothetical protein